MSTVDAPILLQVQTTQNVNALGTNQQGYNLFTAEITLITEQYYNVGNSAYNLTNIVPGMWIAGTYGGFAWKIVSFDGLTLTICDEENYNYFNDPAGIAGGGGIIPNTNHIIFKIGCDGLPVFSPLYNNITDSSLILLFPDIISRFANHNYNRQYISVYQASPTFVVGDPIWINSSGVYEKANNSNSSKVLGVVTSVDIPEVGCFTYKVFGTYYNDIQGSFQGLDLSSYTAGTYLYINTSGGSPYTTTPPNDYVVPIWIYLGIDAITSKQKGILYNNSTGTASGGGGGGTAPPATYAYIKLATNAEASINANSENPASTLCTIPESFGIFAPTLSAPGILDIELNSTYVSTVNGSSPPNFPIILPTIWYSIANTNGNGTIEYINASNKWGSAIQPTLTSSINQTYPGQQSLQINGLYQANFGTLVNDANGYAVYITLKIEN